MSNELINLNPDIKRLFDEGYGVTTSNGYLLIHEVPYLTPNKEIKRGTLVSVLSLAGDRTIKPQTHVAFFIGEQPSELDGRIMVMATPQPQKLTDKITVDYVFSARDDYSDYYQKMTRYIRILLAPVHAVDVTVKAPIFRVIESEEEDSVFKYVDTNSSKAQLHPLSDKLKNQRVGIIGLGGTGGYVLDLVAKTPVREIHLFDGDFFFQHNAFRAPGATRIEKFHERQKKTDYFAEIYSAMHKYVFSHPDYIEESNLESLQGFSFVFLCMDPTPIKRVVIAYLEDNNIPFVDCGIGLQEIDGRIKGQVRLTTSSQLKRDHISKRISFSEEDDELYDRNIQIADLNAMNAVMAVIKWKKLFGFYHDLDKEHHSTYVLYTNEKTNDDLPA